MVSDASFHTGDYKRAISIIDGLKKRNPSLGTLKDILLTQARSYEKSKMPMQAAETYDEYVKLRGVKDADAAYKRAYLREEANPSLAQDIYESNIRSYPEDSRNYLRLGLLYTRNKETLPKAARMLEKAAASVKGADSVWLEIAQVYNQLGKEDKELEAYQKFITGNPQDLKANIRLGTLLMKKGKITEGMVHLETANTIAPNNPEVMELLAKGYVKTRRPQEAISLLEKAKELKPQDVTIRKVLVDLYRKSGDLKRARREVEELVKVKHDNSFLLMYAEILYEDGKYKDVEDVVEDIRATDPENVDALMLLAKAQRARKKWNDAIETYKEIIYINADYVPAIYGRAEVYLEQGKPQWALKFFERAQRADPTFARAYLGLAMVAKLRKDQSTYQTQLKKAYSLDKNDPLIAREYQKAF
jgi:tetratricopeptide (TPR) repeat protein